MNGDVTHRREGIPTTRSANDRSSLRWSVTREVTGLVAIAGGAALVLLLLAGAPNAAANAAAFAFVADLVWWRIACVRLRNAVEHVAAPLVAWQRSGPQIALVEV